MRVLVFSKKTSEPEAIISGRGPSTAHSRAEARECCAQDDRTMELDQSFPGIGVPLALIVCQLSELDQVAAVVLQHGNRGGGYVGGRHGELGAAGFDAFVVALEVVGEEVGGGLVLLKDGLLIGFGRGVVVQSQLEFGASRLLGRGHGQPAVGAVTEIVLLGEAEYVGIETQGFFLVVHVYAGYFNFHIVSPS